MHLEVLCVQRWSTPLLNHRQTVVSERALPTFHVICRVHSPGLECKNCETASVQHVVFHWLLDFATPVVTPHLVRTEGRKAFQRMKHKLSEREVLPFDLQVLRDSEKVADGVMRGRWFLYICLGSQAGSGEHVVHVVLQDHGGIVVRARALGGSSGSLLVSIVFLADSNCASLPRR